MPFDPLSVEDHLIVRGPGSTVVNLFRALVQFGKDADLARWPADPLELATCPDAVTIKGESIRTETRQTWLRDRYLDTSSNTPTARRE